MELTTMQYHGSKNTTTAPIPSPAKGPDELKDLDRLVSVSLLATFLRNYPVTYLNNDERRVFFVFQRFVTAIETKLLEEAKYE